MRLRYQIEELACADCEWLKNNECCCVNRRKDSDLRRCINAARKENLMWFEGVMGEVGPGVNSLIRRMIKSNEGSTYIKIKDNVGAIELEDSSLDGVAAGQCMEHWYQKGDTIEEGLAELHRVLKPRGLLYIDVPIHSHGHSLFLKGDIGAIMEKFPEELWDVVKVQKRRTPCDPLEPLPYKHNGHEYPLVIMVRAKK
jgi:SAM-dependent methyltransferase